MRSETTLKLGDVARCRITGLEGVVIARVERLYGQTDLTIQPQHLQDGNQRASVTFAADRLELVRTESEEIGFKMPETPGEGR
jgi:hypothetical protein